MKGDGYKTRIAKRARGRLTKEEKDSIVSYAETMKNPTPGKIAAKINRLPSTVNWFMLTRGMINRKPGRAPRPYQRGGKTIHPYSAEHDTRIEELRTQDLVFREIAEIITSEFGIPRTAHSVQVRIVQLSAGE